jgi:hypothetical protein
MYSDMTPGKDKTIETTEWAKGIYVLKAVTLKGSVKIVKVIK